MSLAHHRIFVAQWYSIGARKSEFFSFSHARDKTKNIFFSFFIPFSNIIPLYFYQRLLRHNNIKQLILMSVWFKLYCSRNIILLIMLEKIQSIRIQENSYIYDGITPNRPIVRALLGPKFSKRH